MREHRPTRRGIRVPALIFAALTTLGCTAPQGFPEPPVQEPQTSSPEELLAPGLQPCTPDVERAVGGTIRAQIDAFGQGDFDGAYALSAPQFRLSVAREAFEVLIRQGFDSLLSASSVTLSQCIFDPSDDAAETTVTVRTTSDDVVTLRYLLTLTADGWRILAAAPTPPVSVGT